jgi:malate permease and related proteins
MLALRILEIIAPVVGIIGIGYFIGRRWNPDMSVTNRIAIDVLGPMLVFTALSGKDFDLAAGLLLIPASIAIVLGKGAISCGVARVMRVPVPVFVPPMMFNNCGNMGIPLALFAFGQPGMAAMVLLFTTSNLLHFTLGVWMVDHKAKLTDALKSNMVWATFIGAIFGLMKWHIPEPIFVPLKYLGDATIPMMLLALGVRMIGVTRAGLPIALVGAAVCPLAGFVVAWLLVHFFELTKVQAGMIYLFAVLPPAVLNFLVAERYKCDPQTVASIVLIGNLASLIFVPLGLYFALR